MEKSNNWKLAEAVELFQGKLEKSKMDLSFGKIELATELENLERAILDDNTYGIAKVANRISSIAQKNISLEIEINYYKYQISCVDGSNKQN